MLCSQHSHFKLQVPCSSVSLTIEKWNVQYVLDFQSSHLVQEGGKIAKDKASQFIYLPFY